MFKKITRKHLAFGVGIVSVFAAIFYFSTTPTTSGKYVEKEVNEAFNEYISAYTSGNISIGSTIQLRFVQPQVEEHKIGSIETRKLIRFSPNITGELKWVDAFTLAFQPNEWLQPDQVYEVSFQLSDVMDTKKGLEQFDFNFHTIKQDFEVTMGNLLTSATNMKKVALSGKLVTADVAQQEKIEAVLTATQASDNLKITWNHLGDTDHEFTIENINRTEHASEVALTWNGSTIGVNKKGETKTKIPALGDFQVLSVTPQVGAEQYILITYSDPLDPSQELKGLITTDQQCELKFIIENNFIQVYPSKKIIGAFELTLHAGIKNVLGYASKKEEKYVLVFEQVKPAVRLIGSGVIVPASNGLIFPFEAVSLKAVDITITEIFENNAIQFFQTNNLDGNQDLKRVARPIFKKSFVLNTNKLLNLNKWNRFSIDLAQLITPSPGAIYQVAIGFRQSQSVYSCGGETAQDELTPINEDDWTAEAYTDYSYWDYYEGDYYEEYDWQERDNPCHSTYFRDSEKRVTRNIIASNLGIIAKIGKDDKIVIAVTDINTTEPIENVKIEIYDFQQQLIAKGPTNKDGLLITNTNRKPFIIKAAKDSDITYLKVDDGSALSLSNFNVGGTTIQKGLKGFIYGERGVWRPGDTLFMTLILEDKNKVLPKNHPVIFELRNPDGKLEHKLVKKSNVNGFYTYQPITSSEAMTGNWRVYAKVGNTTFSERVKIETIKPNRLKIELDYGKKFLTVNDKNLNGNLEVKWLHGGIAKNLKAEFELVLTKANTTFPKYNNYTFEDQTRQFTPEVFSIFEGNLDSEGKARIPANIQIEGEAPCILNAHFKGKVYEQGGDFSINQFTIPYYPYSSFVGIQLPEGDHRGMLLTDKEQPVDIVCLTPEGVPTGNRYVTCQVYKLDWKWWWDQSSNSSSNYIGVSYRTPIAEQQVKISNGKGSFPMKINYPEWGRYYVKVTDNQSGHSAGKIVFFDWPGWAGKAKKDLPDAASMLTFSADKEKYSVGETMKLTIPGSGEGNALVSIENGTRVIETYWMKLNKGDNQFSINITNKMTPNVYVHVTALQPHAQTINDHPIRMYGIIPIEVTDESTYLNPVIELPKKLSPNKKVAITVTEKEGKPMTFTLAVVDEGLLSLTNHKTPNPWPNFYQHEALGVNTWDIYKYVLGAYGGEIEKILSVGGDAAIINEEGEKAKRFKPVVRFFGPYHIDKSGKKEIEFVMPNYIGAVRTMVVAGYEGAYGSAETETPVRQELMVQGTMPRVLSPGEKLKLPVSIFAYEKNIGTTTIKVKTSGPVKALETTKTITLTDEGDQLVYFDLEVDQKIGIAKVELEARAGNKLSTQVIDIEVRNPNPVISESVEKVLKAGESFSYTYPTLGMKGTNGYSLEASTVPPLNLSTRLDYLLNYPHGCAEQTTSIVFPQLFLSELTDLTSEMKSRVEINIKKGIDRLASMQLADGGFSYWPNQSYTDTWVSSYAGHFFIIAKKKGYYVNSDLVNNWKQYQKKAADNWSFNTNQYNSDLQQAYRLYTLALAGAPNKGAMNRLKERELNKTAQYMLAASYALTGRDDVAKTLIASAPPSTKNYREYAFTYGSQDRDEAMLLLALNAMKEVENGMLAVKKISNRLNHNRWMSTQETAFSLLAISDYMAGQPVSSTVNLNLTVNGKDLFISSHFAVYKQEFREAQLSDKTITITNTSNGLVYLNTNSFGKPLVDKKESSNEIIEMTVRYRDKEGNPIDVKQLPQNNDFLVAVTVQNSGLRGDLKEMALTTIFPSGWEIQNSRMDVVAEQYQTDKPNYQDYRDDRVYTYFDIKSGASKTFTFLINASYAGEFTLPATHCEAMYDNAVQAYVKGGKTRTVK